MDQKNNPSNVPLIYKITLKRLQPTDEIDRPK